MRKHGQSEEVISKYIKSLEAEQNQSNKIYVDASIGDYIESVYNIIIRLRREVINLGMSGSMLGGWDKSDVLMLMDLLEINPKDRAEVFDGVLYCEKILIDETKPK